uniref:fumarate hydratase n=1 Tax=Candidatus Fimivicinus sp. TaxID=3056640 RepID=UPI003FF079D2
MREINVSEVTHAVREMCIEANKRLPEDLTQCISACAGCEEQELPQGIMQDLLDNLDAAKELDIPVCQDTGMAVVFAEVG